MRIKRSFGINFFLLGESRDSAWLLTEEFNDILDSLKVGGPLQCEGSSLLFGVLYFKMVYGMLNILVIHYHGEVLVIPAL